MTQSIVGNLRIVGEFDGARMRAGFEAARSSTNTFSRSAQRDLNRTTTSVERLRRASSRPLFAGGFVAASRSMQTMAQRAEFLQTSMLALTAIFGGFSVAIAGNALMRYADSFTEISNRIRVVTDTTEELNAVQSQLFDIAQRSRSGLRETTILYGRMAVAGRNLGTSQRDLLRITETIQKAFLVGGSTTTEAASSAIQLSQGIASNRLGGDELRSVLENQALGQLLANQIADGSIARFREMAEAGELTADVIMDAFLNASDQIDEAFTQIRPTISQSFVVLDNALMQYFGAADQASGTSELFAQAVMSLAENLDTVIPLLSAVGLGFLAAFAGPKIAAIAANTAAVTSNAFAMQAAAKAAINLAREEVAATAARRAAAAASLQAAQATASAYAMQATAANASAAAFQKAALAQRGLAAAQLELTAASRAATLAQGQLAVATAASTTAIGRLAAGALAFVGGPIGAGLIAIAGGFYLLSLRQTEAERAAEAHAEAMETLDRAMIDARGGTEEQIKSVRRLARENVMAAAATLHLAEAELDAARARYDLAQDPESAMIVGDEMSTAQRYYTQIADQLAEARSRLDTVLSDDFETPGVNQLTDDLDDASTAAKRLAERLEELRLTSMATGLDEIDRKTVRTALSFDVAADAVEGFIHAARSGDLSGVDGTILDIRNMLRLQSAYETAAEVIADLRTPLEQAAEYQRELNNAVEVGALSTDQAAEAYRRYLEEVEGSNEVMSTLMQANKGFIDDMVDSLREGEDFWDSFGDAAANAIDRITDKLLDELLSAIYQVNGVGGQGGGLLNSITGLIGGFFGASGGTLPMPTLGSIYHTGGTVGAGGPGRLVPSTAFANAPKYHDGLFSNEIAAILERGEAVLTRDQQGNLVRAFNGGEAAPVHVVVSVDDDGALQAYVEGAAGRVSAEVTRAATPGIVNQSVVATGGAIKAGQMNAPMGKQFGLSPTARAR